MQLKKTNNVIKYKIKSEIKHHSKFCLILFGFLNLIWLIFRSGKKPSRLSYPCQQAAANQSIWFVGYFLAGTSAYLHKLIYKLDYSILEYAHFKDIRRLIASSLLVMLVVFLFSSSWPWIENTSTPITNNIQKSNYNSIFVSHITQIEDAVVTIVSSENPLLDQPVTIDMTLTYEQVKDMVWMALDMDTSTHSLLKVIHDGDWVVIKPNIVTAPITFPDGNKVTAYWYNGKRHKGQNTDLRVVKSVIEYLVAYKNLNRITIAEGSAEWGKLGQQSTNPSLTMDGWTVHWQEFGDLSYVDIVNDINAQHPDLVDIVDLSYDRYRWVSVPDPNNSGIKGLYRNQYAMPVTVLDCDKWIDIPVMKTHNIPGVTLAHKLRIGTLANQAYESTPNSSYHQMHLEGDDGVIRGFIDLFSYHPSDYVVIEGIWGTEGDGPQWGDDIKRNMIIVSHDPVAADAVAATAMGFNPWDLEFLHLSTAKGFGTFDFDKITILGNSVDQIKYDFSKSTGPTGENKLYIGRSNRNWLINGIYQGTDLTIDYISGETSIMPREGMISGGHAWQIHTNQQNKIDFKQIFGTSANYCITYAFIYVYTSQDLSTNLWIGVDDGIKVWVNSQLVLTDDTPGAYHVAEHQVPISLHKGINTILCKISNYTEEFEFSLNICDNEGDTPLEIIYLTDHINTAPTTPILGSPDDGVMTNQNHPELRWGVPFDIDDDSLHFKVEISPDEFFGFGTHIYESRDNIVGFNPVPPVPQGTGIINYYLQLPLSDGDWWWRISAWDGFTYSNPSLSRKLTIDTTPPHINNISLQNPGYSTCWYNQSMTSEVKICIQYDEAHANLALLNAGTLENPLEQANLPSGENQTVEFVVNISDDPDGLYSCIATIQDLVGNATSDSITISLDSSPPIGAVANSPDTSFTGSFIVNWANTASDASGSGLSGKYDARIKIDDGDWSNWLFEYEDEEYDFSSTQPGQTYYFEVITWDNLQNREEFTGIAECSTYIATTTKLDEEKIKLIIPDCFFLNQNYPNPFNAETNIAFGLPMAQYVVIKVYNMQGKLISIITDEYKEPGIYHISWNAINEPSGIYICHFQTGQFVKTLKLLLIK